LKKELLNLLEIRSIVAILMTIVFVVLVIRGDIENNAIINTYSIIISFYFGTRFGNRNKSEED